MIDDVEYDSSNGFSGSSSLKSTLLRKVKLERTTRTYVGIRESQTAIYSS